MTMWLYDGRRLHAWVVAYREAWHQGVEVAGDVTVAVLFLNLLASDLRHAQTVLEVAGMMALDRVRHG